MLAVETAKTICQIDTLTTETRENRLFQTKDTDDGKE